MAHAISGAPWAGTHSEMLGRPATDSLVSGGRQGAEHADKGDDEQAEKLFAYDVITKPK
jgi:hypothetical protein